MIIVGAAALFIEPLAAAVGEPNFSPISYSSQAELILEQLPLLIALLILVVLGRYIIQHAS